MLISPDRTLATVHNLRIDNKSRVIARILGARHLTQAVLSGHDPSPEVLAMGTWVDSVHALTAFGLAVVDRGRARAGATDAIIAAVWAGAGYRDLHGARGTSPRHQRIRDQLAVMVLSHVPAGPPLLRTARRDRRGAASDSRR